MRCYPSVLDIPDPLDLAVITIPAVNVPPVLEECGRKKIPFAIVVAGGFGETGEEGKKLQEQLLEVRQKYGIRILGPNTLGVFYPEQSFDTIFVEHGDKSLAGGGATAVISQSGSVGIEALGLASNIGFGLRTFVGLGNKCDLDELDFLRHFAEESGTRLIAFYLENINEGRQFLETCREVSRAKPIIGLKAGRTASGASAVSSHTGRLAGMDLVVEGAFRQYGILRVQDDEELTDACRALEKCPLPRGNRVAVLSPAGGYGVICSDYIETPHPFIPLQMARLLPETEHRIRSVTLPFASCHNPVDITASASSEMYGKAMEAILEDPGVDILICLVFWSPPGIEDDLLEIIAQRVKDTDKPVIVFTTYGPFTDRYLLEFWKRDVVGYSSIERTVRAARFLVERSTQLKWFAREDAQVQKDSGIQQDRTSGSIVSLAGNAAFSPKGPRDQTGGSIPDLSGGPDSGPKSPQGPSVGSTIRLQGATVSYRRGTTDQKSQGVFRKNRSAIRRVEQWLEGLEVKGKPDEFEVKELLKRFGIPVPRGIRIQPEMESARKTPILEQGPPPQSLKRSHGVHSAEGTLSQPIMRSFQRLNLPFPVVVKVCGSSFLHKTEMGGVRIGVEAWELESVLMDFRARFPEVSLLVEEQVDFVPPELLVGGIKDPQFGMALVLGTGGILTEVYKDVTSRLCPVTEGEAEKMLSELRIRPIFEGYRDLPFDRQGLVQLLVRISELFAAIEGLVSQLDLNPVVYCRDRGWIVLDGKVVV